MACFTFGTEMARVRPNLLLGAAPHEGDYAMLREAGVTHILQVGSELRPSFPGRFVYERASIDDAEQEDIIRLLPRCLKFIEGSRRGGGVVLVHCMAGMSRSAAVVVAALMAGERLPYAAAFGQVKAARPCIYPNIGFLLQLWEWEALGCDTEAWPGWGKARFAERLGEYRRAQTAAGLHPAVRVRLAMAPPAPAAAAPQGPPGGCHEGAEDPGKQGGPAEAAAVAAAGAVGTRAGAGPSPLAEAEAGADAGKTAAEVAARLAAVLTLAPAAGVSAGVGSADAVDWQGPAGPAAAAAAEASAGSMCALAAAVAAGASLACAPCAGAPIAVVAGVGVGVGG